jgi:putative endonuclease
LTNYYVYILTNRSGTLYTGVTRDLFTRVHQHKRRGVPGFTSRYRIDRLVYFEEVPDPVAAICREKQIKAWSRKKRIDLINGMNPKWRDLSEEWGEPEEPGQPLLDSSSRRNDNQVAARPPSSVQ